MEKKSTGDQKAQEYAARIKSGEDKDEIINGLPPTFVNSIEKILASADQRLEEDKVAADAQRERLGLLKRELGELTAEQIEALKTEIKEKSDQVYFKNRHTFRDQLFEVAHGVLPDGSTYQLVDGEVGKNFDAHGIAKTDMLEKLMALLENGINPEQQFFTAPFELPNEDRAGLGAALGTGGGTAYKDGIAVVTAGYGELLLDKGIKHVFVNDLYAPLAEPLQRLFPQYRIHLLSEQKEVLESEVR